MNGLTCVNVSTGYLGKTVVRDFSLDLPPQGLLQLAGPNGIGKSTVLKTIMGITSCLGGAIFLDGREITGLPVHRRAALGLAMLRQSQPIFDSLSTHENLTVNAPEWRERFGSLPAGIRDVLHRLETIPARFLSGGQRQIVGLGNLFLRRPRIALLDEPANGMAPELLPCLRELISRLLHEGTGVLLIEHSDLVASLANLPSSALIKFL